MSWQIGKNKVWKFIKIFKNSNSNMKKKGMNIS